MRITLSHSVPAAPRILTDRALETAAMFGLLIDEEDADGGGSRCEMPIIEPVTIDLPIPGPGIVFITGPSGGGKSTALRLIAQACAAGGCRVLSGADLPPLDSALPIVDVISGPAGTLAEAHALLSLAGLSDAFVMLRTARELSDGQRARLELARLMEMAGAAHYRVPSAARAQDHNCTNLEQTNSTSSAPDATASATPAASPVVIVVDEFAATLDRLTALTLARNVRRWIDRTGHTFIAATTHDDLFDALEPEMLIVKELGGATRVERYA